MDIKVLYHRWDGMKKIILRPLSFLLRHEDKMIRCQLLPRRVSPAFLLPPAYPRKEIPSSWRLSYSVVCKTHHPERWLWASLHVDRWLLVRKHVRCPNIEQACPIPQDEWRNTERWNGRRRKDLSVPFSRFIWHERCNFSLARNQLVFRATI